MKNQRRRKGGKKKKKKSKEEEEDHVDIKLSMLYQSCSNVP